MICQLTCTEKHRYLVDRRGMLSVTDIIIGMEWTAQVQILGEVVYISVCSNAHKKGINSSIISPAMGK